MTYSCGIYPTLDGDLVRSSTQPKHPWTTRDELERSQYAKLHHIIRKAKIARGHRVLEIGSGWGSFAIEAVRSTGCTVDTLTLSSQQKSLAEERIRQAGLQGQIRVHLMDFRSIPKDWWHTFDRVVSIEMLEAVGKEYIGPYFEMIDNVLNEHGVACFQVITIPEARFATCKCSTETKARVLIFINPQTQTRTTLSASGVSHSLFGYIGSANVQTTVFPGGFLPSVSYTTEMIEKGAQGRLVIDSICNIGVSPSSHLLDDTRAHCEFIATLRTNVT